MAVFGFGLSESSQALSRVQRTIRSAVIFFLGLSSHAWIEDAPLTIVAPAESVQCL